MALHNDFVHLGILRFYRYSDENVSVIELVLYLRRQIIRIRHLFNLQDLT